MKTSKSFVSVILAIAMIEWLTMRCGGLQVQAGGQACYQAVQVTVPPDRSRGCDPLAACPEPAKRYNPYKECRLSAAGATECRKLGQVAYETIYPCEWRINWIGLLGCIAALILAGVSEAAVCSNPGGVLTAACWAVITANMSVVFAACNYCAIGECRELASGTVVEWRDDYGQAGDACPE